MGMRDVATAADLRKSIEKIAANVVNRMRPDLRIGRVFSFNLSTQVAQILFPGNTIESLVPARFALDKIPTVAMIDTFADEGYDAIGDIVRIAGKPKGWFILDFISGSPAQSGTVYNDPVDTSSQTVLAMQDELTVDATGDQTLHLTFRPIENSEHLYWEGVYQPGSEWSRDEWDVFIPDPDGVIQVNDRLVMEYLYTDDTHAPDAEPISLSFIGVTTASADPVSTIALPAGSEPGDIVVVGVSTYFKALTGITDSRIGNQINETDPIPATNGAGGYCAGYGILGVDLGDIAIGSGGAAVVCAVFRPNRTPVITSVFEVGAENLQAFSSVHPATPAGDAGIMILLCTSGTVNNTADVVTGAWTLAAHRQGPGVGKSNVGIAYSLSGTPDGTFTGSSIPGGWCYMALGVK